MGVSSVHLCMRGGKSKESYYEYAGTLQSNLNEFYWPKLSAAIATAFPNMYIPYHPGNADDNIASTCKLAVADLGCSCAMNTINVMRFVVKCLRAQRLMNTTSASSTIIQVFFNDVASNDFNTLFGLLDASVHPNHADSVANGVDDDNGKEHFYTCAVPGTFHARLFPPASLHVAFSSLALHNLSQVPKSIQDPTSPAWNEGGIWTLEDCKPETIEEYKKQFLKDFVRFLRHRSKELVHGGLLFCVMIAAKEHPPHKSEGFNKIYTILQNAWRELVAEGLMDKDTLDTFNLPRFTPTLDDIREAVAACGGAFEIIELEYSDVENSSKHVWDTMAAADAHMWGNTCVMMLRNFAGSLIEAHLGLDKSDLLMERVKQLASADFEHAPSHVRFMSAIVLALLRS